MLCFETWRRLWPVPVTLCALGLATLSLPCSAADPGDPACSPSIGRIVSRQGEVDVRRAGTLAWSKATLDSRLCAGDSVRTGRRSRAAVLVAPENLIRLDQNSAVSITSTGSETLVEFFNDDGRGSADPDCGAAYLLSRFPKSLKVRTPFLNASIKGTEFLVEAGCSATTLAVIEGSVAATPVATGGTDSVLLESGDAIRTGADAATPLRFRIQTADAVQWSLHYPALAVPTGADDESCSDADGAPGAQCRIRGAESSLRVGRVDLAREQLRKSLERNPEDADALALLAVIALVRNEKVEARELSGRAVASATPTPRAWMARSFVQQADFSLESALHSAQTAATLDPSSAAALARVAELQLSLGWTDQAVASAKAAAAADPGSSRARTVLGFAWLVRLDAGKAATEFRAAIDADSSDPLPRLGLGLATIRAGNLAAGREEIEIATVLDPTNSLLRSYAGKAYFEENTPDRNRLAAGQFELARRLDPADPTPDFYESILKQVQNRPVEALELLQKSVERNDNRAVYRSRLLLDEDRASRAASIAGAFRDLGFERPASVLAAQSVFDDPGNASAHQFLADSLLRVDRQDITRVSELLQSQLLQGLNARPREPYLPFVDLGLTGANTSFGAGLNEYTSLYERNRVSLTASALAGNLGTVGQQVIVSGLRDKVAFSAAEFSYDTDGFRPNNDLRHRIQTLFAQVEMLPTLGFQFEVRRRETDNGDRNLVGSPTNYDPNYRRALDQDTVRVGARWSPGPETDLLLSVVKAGLHEEVSTVIPGPGPVTALFDDRGDQVEVQGIRRAGSLRLVGGAGWMETGLQAAQAFVNFPCTASPCDTRARQQRNNQYLHGYFSPYPWLGAIVGVSHDALESANLVVDRINPKFALRIAPHEWIAFRVAAFQSVRPVFTTNQTIEPVQLLGFSQYFDDVNGTVSRTVAAGIDITAGPRTYIGLDGRRRKLEDPFNTFGVPDLTHPTEEAYRVVVNRILASELAVGFEYRNERFHRSLADASANFLPRSLHNQIVPLTVRWFPTERWFAGATVTTVRQESMSDFLAPGDSGVSRFTVADFSVGYRLPGRHGALSFDVRNAFDQSFFYQDLSFLTSEPLNPRFLPTRTFFVRVTLSM